MGRAPCCEKVGLKRGRWTAEEDEILTNYIQANGEGSWRSLPKNAGLLRCGKSCRLRWINYLRSDLKRGNITAAEEDVIIKLHASLGNRWSLIAGHLAGRTDNEIKNYWNSHLSRKIHSFRRLSNENQAVAVPVVMDLTKASIAAKRRGGRTSRSAMKKNKSYINFIPAPELSAEKPFLKDIQSGVMEGMVPIMPTTPTLEKEATSWNNNDIVVVDPCPTEEEEEEGRTNLAVLSDSQRGMWGSSDDDQERENNILMSCPSSDNRNSELELVGSFEGLDSPMLCFNDILGDDLQELGPKGYFTTGKEGETINNVVGSDERENGVTDSNTIKEVDVDQRGNLSSNGDHSSSGDWYSCTTSTNSYMEDIIRADWDWDFNNDWDMGTVVQGHHLPRDVEEEEKTSWTSLWESDNLDKDSSTAVMLGEDEIDCEKHEALVAWLLS